MILDWWNDIVRWFGSADGWRVLSGAILPFLAILIAGLLAGVIARGSTKRLIAQHDRQHKAAVVASLLSAARQLANWSTLSATEKDHADRQASEAEIRVRLLPLDGAGLAADWAAHRLASLKRNSAAYGSQEQQDLLYLQDGLVAWQGKPRRARRLFAQDLAAWKYEAPAAADALLARQREWATAQETNTPAHAASNAN